MKALSLGSVVGLALLGASLAAQAQIGVPISAVDDVRIVGFKDWRFEKDAKGENYIARMKVCFENKGQNNLVFLNPDFTVFVARPKRQMEAESPSSVVKRAGQTDATIVPVATENLDPLPVGKATVLRPKDATSDWEPRVEVKAASAATGVKSRAMETVQEFFITVGPVDLATADRMMDIFNTIMNKDRDWSLLLKGLSNVGVMGESGAEVSTKDPIKIVIKSKPKIVSDVNN